MVPSAAADSSAAWIAPSHGSSSGVANTPYTSGAEASPDESSLVVSLPVVPPQAVRIQRKASGDDDQQAGPRAMAGDSTGGGEAG